MTVDEEKRMRSELCRLLNILRRHPGRDNAISMLALYEQWSGNQVERNEQGKPVEDVATLSRGMRHCIEELVYLHGIPVMSSSRGGYWIVTDRKELEDVLHEIKARGLASLQKAARLAQNSLIDTVNQLALDLQNGDSQIHQHLSRQKKPASEEKDLGDLVLSPEARMAVITRHVQELLDAPDRYADQIRALQAAFGPKLLPRRVLEEINKQADQVRHLANETIEAANRLQTMVGL